MSRSSRMAKAAAKTTGNAKAISAVQKENHRNKNDTSILPVRMLLGTIGLVQDAHAKRDVKNLRKVQAEIRDIEEVYRDSRALAGQDSFASRYADIMHRLEVDAKQKKMDRLQRKVDRLQHRGKIPGQISRGLRQSADTLTRKAAYSQMVGRQSGVSAQDLAVASYAAQDTFSSAQSPDIGF